MGLRFINDSKLTVEIARDSAVAGDALFGNQTKLSDVDAGCKRENDGYRFGYNAVPAAKGMHDGPGEKDGAGGEANVEFVIGVE